MSTGLPLYFAYHIGFFLVIMLMMFRFRGSVLLFVASAAAMSVMCDQVLPSADLEWYRWRFESTDWDTILLVAIEEDFEFGWFLGSTILKSILGDVATPGMLLFCMLCLPLLIKSCREKLWLFALFLIFPGTFLMLNNVIRQGFAEYIVLIGLIVGSVSTQFSSALFHRFGGFVAALYIVERFVRTRRKFFLALGCMFVGTVAFKFFMPEGMTESYGHLIFNPASFVMKLVTAVLPFAYVKLFYSWEELSELAEGRLSILMIGVVIGFLAVSGRMADRAAFFVLPVTLSAMRLDRGGVWGKIAFSSIILLLGLGSLFLFSHQVFFIDGVGVGGSRQ